jgi:hypothetical protein
MSDIIKIQVDLPVQDNINELQSKLVERTQAILAGAGIAPEDVRNDMHVSVAEHPALAVDPVTAGVVVAGFTLAGKLIDLYKFLKEQEKQGKDDVDAESAKQVVAQADEEQRRRWRQEFVEQVLVHHLLREMGLYPNSVTIEVVNAEQRNE